MSAAATRAEAPVAADVLVDFVYDETDLIDSGRLEEWLELFAADGIFWAPLTPGQPDPDLHTSLYHEDRLLLQVKG